MSLKLVFALALSTLPAQAAEFNVDTFLKKTHVSVGVGYKFRETQVCEKSSEAEFCMWNDPYSARLEVSYHYSKAVRFGLSHHSQWLSGFPFNNKSEYAKTELFIDYTFALSDLF